MLHKFYNVVTVVTAWEQIKVENSSVFTTLILYGSVIEITQHQPRHKKTN
jgi:hypothetical protein